MVKWHSKDCNHLWVVQIDPDGRVYKFHLDLDSMCLQGWEALPHDPNNLKCLDLFWLKWEVAQPLDEIDPTAKDNAVRRTLEYMEPA